MTGSRAFDVLVFGLLACFIAAVSYRLAVYHRVTVTDITVMRLAPDAAPLVLLTPQQFRKTYYAASAHRIMMDHIEREVVAFMRDADGPYRASSGTIVRWIIRYGDNTTHPDRRLVIDFQSDNGERME